MLRSRLSFAITCLLFLIFVLGAWTATGFGKLASYFPITVALIGAVLAVVELVMARGDHVPTAMEEPDQERGLRRSLSGGALNLLWIALYVAAMVAVGFFSATWAFLFMTLWRGAHYSAPKAAIVGLAACILLYWFGGEIGLTFPRAPIDAAILEWLEP